jgi:hypothetical protein
VQGASAHREAAAPWVSQLTTSLDGIFFGVDFKPVPDRLRIIRDTGQNLRHNVNTEGTTTVDGSLNYTVGITTTGLTSAAYTNNDLDPPRARYCPTSTRR